MTKLANTAASDDSAQGKSPTAQAEPNFYDQGRPAFRFGLRHLFWFVTGVSVLLAATASFPEGSYGSLALLLAIAVVALHLMSTAVGSHLRAEADKHMAVFLPTDVSAALASKATEASHSPLRTHGLAVRWLPLLVAAGAVRGRMHWCCLARVDDRQPHNVPWHRRRGPFDGSARRLVRVSWQQLLSDSPPRLARRRRRPKDELAFAFHNDSNSRFTLAV